MKTSKWIQVIATAIAITGMSACGSKKGTSTASVSINVLQLATMQNMSELQSAFRGLTDIGTFASGYNAAADLQDLVYPFGGISLCDSVTGKDSADLTSFGFDGTTGCTSLYESALDDGNHIGLQVPDLITKYGQPDNIFNLMDATDLTKLKAASKAATVGSYNYVVVTWPALIGVKGSVVVNDGTAHTLHTKAGASYSSLLTTVPDMTTAGNERTYIQSANGGMVSKFSAPLAVETGKEYLLDIVFNPESVLKACNSTSGASISDGTYGITVPMLPITAVLREKTDTLVRESYLIATGTTNLDFRLDLYYLKSDATKSVLASTLTGLASNTNGDCNSNTDNRILRVVKGTDGNFTFYATSNDASVIMSGFGRTATGGTVTVQPFNISANSGMLGLPASITTATALNYGAVTVTELSQ